MSTTLPTHEINPKLERIANILRLVGWGAFWAQIGLGITSIFLLMLTISGRQFNRAVEPTTINPTVPYNQAQPTIPGVGISIFWAITGILLLLFGCYTAYRITRYGKRLKNPEPRLHPQKAEVMQLLKWGAIAGFIGILLFMIGSVFSLGVILAKSISQPQGVAIYDPARIIRSLDVFIAMANVNGIAAHFTGTAASAGLFIWLHPEL